MLVAKCGRGRSNSGKPFTEQTLAQHEVDCPWCNGTGDMSGVAFEPDAPDFELANTIAGDESDGVFFSVAHELGEW